MHGREATHLETLLRELIAPVGEFMEEHPDKDPLAVMVAFLLHKEEPGRCPIPDLALQDAQLIKAGRAYLALLNENDQMPPGRQLTRSELAMPRGLLLDFFLDQSGLQRRAQEVLGLIERKFSEREFHQANILLQLFETDQSTRVQNERKLFYEDMIQRLGIRRRDALSGSVSQTIREHFEDISRALQSGDQTFGAEEDDDLLQNHGRFVPVTRSLNWLAEEYQIRFCVLLRDPEMTRSWREVAKLGEDVYASAMERIVPPARWRLTREYEEVPLLQVLKSHLSLNAIQEYVRTLTRSCYFVLLAVGDTGLEGFIDTYFDWLKDKFQIDGTAFIDRLHRESTMGEQTLQETLDAIYEEFFAEVFDKIRDEITPERLDDAVQNMTALFQKADLAEVAPGYFNLGGFVLDQLLEVPYPSNEFSFKLHRIS